MWVLDRVPEECPAAVADLIDRCLSFEPGARPSAKEIVQQLCKCDAERAHPPVGPKVATSRASAGRRRQKVCFRTWNQGVYLNPRVSQTLG